MAATFTLFQFTRARGARRAGRPDVVHGGVSIHARTGRATFWDGSVAAGSVFQFTRARGARQTSTPPSRGMAAVSIHARTGRATGILLCHEHGVLVSIHARTGRATSSPFRPWSVSAFQFTRARGARRAIGRLDAIGMTFQFTRARGARLAGPLPPVLVHRFNSRAHGARDAWPSRPSGVRRCFNSRAHGARDLGVAPPVRAHDVSIHARTGRAT